MNHQAEPPAFFTKDQVILLKKTLLAQFSIEEQELFITRCEREKLDPFSGQIHPTRRMTKVRNKDGVEEYVPRLVPVVGIYGLLKRAAATGHYDGCEIFWCGPSGQWKEEWLEEDFPTAAKAIVHHKNRTHPEVAIARWISFAQQTRNKQTKAYELSDFWAKMGEYMLSKCAKAAALRGAFPDELSGLYIREELGSMSDLDIVTGEEEKIAESQKREKETVIPGAKFVEPSPGSKRPTPAEAAEPAFPEDKAKPAPIEPRATPAFAKKLAEEQAAAAQAAQGLAAQQWPPPEPETGAAPQEPDDLDMGPVSKAPKEAVEPAAPTRPEWMDHVIRSVPHPRFLGKKISDLEPKDLLKIETQWIPKIEADMGNASDDQKLDYKFFQAAIAYAKMSKPFGP